MRFQSGLTNRRMASRFENSSETLRITNRSADYPFWPFYNCHYLHESIILLILDIYSPTETAYRTSNTYWIEWLIKLARLCSRCFIAVVNLSTHLIYSEHLSTFLWPDCCKTQNVWPINNKTKYLNRIACRNVLRGYDSSCYLNACNLHLCKSSSFMLWSQHFAPSKIQTFNI